MTLTVCVCVCVSETKIETTAKLWWAESAALVRSLSLGCVYCTQQIAQQKFSSTRTEHYERADIFISGCVSRVL